MARQYTTLEVIELLYRNEDQTFLNSEDKDFHIFRSQDGNLYYGILGNGLVKALPIFSHMNDKWVLPEKEITWDELLKSSKKAKAKHVFVDELAARLGMNLSGIRTLNGWLSLFSDNLEPQELKLLLREVKWYVEQ